MIKVYAVDDELPALEELEYLLKTYDDIEVVGLFSDPLEAIRNIVEDEPDVVFLDIDMPFINGIELALQMQTLRAGLIIVFVSAHTGYSLQAFKAYPLDYILKPIDEDRFRQTLEHIREQHKLRQIDGRSQKTFSIGCFGKLEVSKGDGPKESMKLSNRKIKELFAYLICRFGKPVTRRELIQLLFDGVEDKRTINHLHVTVYNLRNMLESFGIPRSLVEVKENYTLEMAAGICDYVDVMQFMKNHPMINAINVKEAERLIDLYKGAYLEEEDYDWAIETREWLGEQLERLLLKIANFYSSIGKTLEEEQALLRLVEINPLAEEGNQALLMLYFREGNKERFIRFYESYAKVLREELDEEPEERLARTYLAMKNS